MENTVKKVNVRVGDTVLILAGNYKGKKGKIISVDEVLKLAKLPSREMLLTQLATALLANIRNLAVVLDQTKQKLEENA